jgi:mannose/fructose/N-acetylgalactosamine-specific phosphotransferase system component IID
MPLDHGKEALATTTLDAQPEAILRMAEDSVMPLLLALALTALFAGLIVKLWWLVLASFVVGLLIQLVWLWPRAELGERRPA